MSQANDQVYTPKLDLHIGGLGAASSGTLGDYYLGATDDEADDGSGPDDWIERARNALGDTNRFVHESPWRALAMAAGIGFLGGVLFARRA
jgi:hypothetical protein